MKHHAVYTTNVENAKITIAEWQKTPGYIRI